MSVIVTVRKNWKKKLENLCQGVDSFTSYRLDNGFVGEKIETGENFGDVISLNVRRNSKLTYDKASGVCVLHHHSNHWIEWTNKINW